jgi:hypothetical protein
LHHSLHHLLTLQYILQSPACIAHRSWGHCLPATRFGTSPVSSVGFAMKCPWMFFTSMLSVTIPQFPIMTHYKGKVVRECKGRMGWGTKTKDI